MLESGKAHQGKPSLKPPLHGTIIISEYAEYRMV